MRLTDLRTNHVSAPLGYSCSPLSFSWKVEAEGTQRKQKCARISIEKDGAVIYDSGDAAEADSLDFPVDLE